MRCGSVPPAWPGVPVTFTLTSGCASAAAQNCKPSQVKTDLATQSSWCGLCPPAHRGQHELAQKANRAPDCLESRMGGGEEQDGCFGGQVSLQSQRNQHPGPKVVCDEFFHQFGGRVRESSVILGKRCRKLRRWWKRGLALHLLTPARLILFQRQFYDVMQAGSQRSVANLVLSVLSSGCSSESLLQKMFRFNSSCLQL